MMADSPGTRSRRRGADSRISWLAWHPVVVLFAQVG